MELSPEMTTGLVAMGSAVIAALPGLITTLMNRGAEEKKQLRELAVQAAIESWKTHAEFSVGRPILPLEHYIVHTVLMFDLALSGKTITPDAMRDHLVGVKEIMDVMVSHASAPPKNQG